MQALRKAIAKALSARWNERGKMIYPTNSTPKDWIESGDVDAALDALSAEGWVVLSSEEAKALDAVVMGDHFEVAEINSFQAKLRARTDRGEVTDRG
jgi:hypothetical protein